MMRPWRRYVLALSLRLKTPANQLLEVLDSTDIAEYMAFDITQDEEWRKKLKQKQELELSRSMSPEEKEAAFMAAMGRS